MKSPDASIPSKRRSASADASLLAEIERLKKMTAKERMLAALSMGKYYTGNKDLGQDGKDGEK